MTQIELLPSRTQSYLTTITHLVVVLLVVFSSLYLLFKLLALGCCLFSYYLAEHARRVQIQYRYLVFDHGEFSLVNELGQLLPCALRGEILSSPWLIILNVLFDGSDKKQIARRNSLVLFRDAMHEEDWRRLRVVLRTLPGTS